VRPAWLSFLQAPEFLGHVLLLVQNTLHSQLLERSLQLLAALLQADELQEQQEQQQQLLPAVAGEQQSSSSSSRASAEQQLAGEQQKQPIYERLMQAGLITAVEAILAPTVEAGPTALEALIMSAANGRDSWDDAGSGENPAGNGAAEQPANSAVGEAAAAEKGGWSDNDNDMPAEQIAADAGNVEQRTRELYRSQDVLEMLLALLLQLGSCQESAAATLQQLPNLPQVLLHVLAASSSQRQQRVLEALLPVLVVFRDGVVPLMQPVLDSHLEQHMQQQQEIGEISAPAEQQQQQQVGGTAAPAQLQQQQHEQEEQQQLQQQQVKALCLLACIAGTLQDGEAGPQSLDALDAGWYLLALATHNLTVLDIHRQQQQELDLQLLYKWHALICTPASCRLLELLCTRLNRSPAPDTAAAYVRATAHALATCVTAMLFVVDRMPAGQEQQQQQQQREGGIQPGQQVVMDQQQQEQEADAQQQQQGLRGSASRRMQAGMLQAAGAVSQLACKVRQLGLPEGAEGLGEN
jgi:hypothetical protein